MGPDGSEGWDPALDDLVERRRVSRVDGRRRAADEAPRRREARRPRPGSRTLLDPGSFQELGTLVGGEDAPADAIVMGSGRIDGRPVMVAAEDFTVKAGTISSAANSKRYRVAEIAVLDRVPLIMMLEGAGFRADGRPRRPHADRPARAGALLGPGAAGHRGARRRRPATARSSRRCRTSA